MSFNTNIGRAEYTASGGQTEFAYVFKTYNTSDIKVYLTPTGNTPDDAADILVETTDYTVVQNGDLGGTVTLVSPATADDTVVIVRVLPINRTVDYQQGGDLLESVLDEDQNYQTYLAQQNAQDQARYLQVSNTTTNFDATLPSAAPGYLKFKDDGTGMELDTTVATSVAAAEASAAAALVSENNAAGSAASAAADVATIGTSLADAEAAATAAETSANDAATSATASANSATTAAGSATSAAASASQADASRAAAQLAEASAAAIAQATEWVSGTTYAEGDCVWSPIDYQTYRRAIAGAGTTDPSIDDTNWAILTSPGGAITTTPTITITTTVNENSTTQGTISNYDAAAIYTFADNLGTINYTSGSTFDFVAHDIVDDQDAADTFTVYAEKIGELRSETTTVNMTIEYVNVISDTAVTYNSTEFTTTNY